MQQTSSVRSLISRTITKMKKTGFKEKATSLSGGISGTVGVLGSYQVCHSICLGIIYLLSFIGITLVGMPLLFLTKVAVPFWIAAVLLLILAIVFYVKRRCISKNMLFLNSGLIIAGTPSQLVGYFSRYFLIIGTIVLLIGLFFVIRDKARRMRRL